MSKKWMLRGLITLTIASVGIAAYFIFAEVKTNVEPNLIYTFEVVRHGARAPLIHADEFPVPAEMLTP